MNSGKRDINFAYLRPVVKGLRRLSKQVPSPILADMEAFEAAWRQGDTVDRLRASFDFKQVSADDTCRKEKWVYQIHVQQNWRAHLTFVERENLAYWVNVFVKNGKRQNEEIRSSCATAGDLQRRGKQ